MNAPADGSPFTSRIAAAFAKARAQGRKALVLYLTGCDPDFDTSRRLLLAAVRAGADVLELGVPWSDPSADGPAIQAAMRRALAAGGGMAKALDLCRAVRADSPDVPVVLFGYANPIFVRGTVKFAAQAKQAGADGVLCVDWPKIPSWRRHCPSRDWTWFRSSRPRPRRSGSRQQPRLQVASSTMSR